MEMAWGTLLEQGGNKKIQKKSQMTTEVSPWLHEILILKLFVTIYHCHLGEYPIPMSVGSGYLLLFIVLISCALIYYYYYYYYYLLAP
jgi:hypothetical protein